MIIVSFMYEYKEIFPLKSWYKSNKGTYACFVPSQVIPSENTLALQCTEVLNKVPCLSMQVFHDMLV